MTRPVDPDQGPFRAGDTLLKYEVRGFLGRGGHAFVYHGYDPFLDRHVAIKIIVSPADPGRDLSRRAQLEARVLCRLQHPNVVRVIDAGVTGEGFVYIIMELLLGRTLRDALVDVRSLTVAETLAIGANIADGVSAAHKESTIHRDLKPENVFLEQANFAKVLDFGIAKFLGYDAMTTQKDLIHGTMLYVSPEHLQGLGATARSDIFALGTILYESLAGIPPSLMGVEEPTMNALAWAQINRMPPPLDELTKTVPRHVARAIHRMIAKDPADRYASMAEVAETLRACSGRLLGEQGPAALVQRQLWTKLPEASTSIGMPRPEGASARASAPGEPEAGNSHTAPGVATVHRPSRPSAPRRGSSASIIVATAVGLGVAVGLVGGIVRFRAQGPSGDLSASPAAASVAPLAQASTRPPVGPAALAPSAVPADPAEAPTPPAETSSPSTAASRSPAARGPTTTARPPSPRAVTPSRPPTHPSAAPPRPAFGAEDI